MALETSYGARATGSPGVVASDDKDNGDYWPLSKLRKCYTDYLFVKRSEIDEQIEARRYYHGSQWTQEQIAAMRKRKQPVMTFNREARKIDGIVGLLEKLRQDPKAWARTPQHEQGAELATAALRYVLDEQQWKAKSPICAQDAAIDGIGGMELELIQGDAGDPDVGFSDVDIASHFYDPRSFEPDFADARYQGTGKWVDEDIARDMFPNADANAFSSDSELVSNTDREMRWFQQVGQQKRVRLIDIWYQHKGKWCWAIFTGTTILMQGESPFKDEKGKTFSKYIMFSGNVDQDGDRYGFHRNMKSPQDGINAKQSKLQHILASKRLIISQGAISDVEATRREWARPDGVVVTNRPVNEGVKADDQSFDFAGWTKMLEFNVAEFENFGPNHALVGQGGVEDNSGKAIQLLQQAGMAELGPYILAYRGWKIRFYRAIWNTIKTHWKGERWVRVTDDQDLAQYIQINGMGVDPNTGMPTIVNAIGQLDVDVVLDEAPDATTLQMQSYDTLQSLGPAFIQQFPMVAIELAPLDQGTKKRMREQIRAASQQPNPEVQAKQAELQAKQQEMVMGLQAEREKNAGNLEAKKQEIALNFVAKQREQDLEHEHQTRTLALQHHHENQRMEMEHGHKEREAQRNLQVEREKNAMSQDNDMAKHEMSLVYESASEEKKEEAKNKVKERQADIASRAQVANFKPIADAMAGAVKEIAHAVEGMTKAVEAVAAPKKINLTRDKSGRVTGGTATAG